MTDLAADCDVRRPLTPHFCLLSCLFAAAASQQAAATPKPSGGALSLDMTSVLAAAAAAAGGSALPSGPASGAVAGGLAPTSPLMLNDGAGSSSGGQRTPPVLGGAGGVLEGLLGGGGSGGGGLGSLLVPGMSGGDSLQLIRALAEVLKVGDLLGFRPCRGGEGYEDQLLRGYMRQNQWTESPLPLLTPPPSDSRDSRALQ